MGVENSECVIATTHIKEQVDDIREWIFKTTSEERYQEFSCLFHVGEEMINRLVTIIMMPSGSKKGWDADKKCEVLRGKFIEFLESFAYEDGSNCISYVEVGFGEFGQKLLRGNNMNMYNDNDYAINTNNYTEDAEYF